MGSGKTALLLALCQRLRDNKNVVVVTNDIFTREVCPPACPPACPLPSHASPSSMPYVSCLSTSRPWLGNVMYTQDGEFLTRNKALEPQRIRAVETGGCPHAAIREDVSANLLAAEELTVQHKVSGWLGPCI